MGNAWTRLLQEAAKSGGPEALKAAYKSAGQLQGIVIGGAAVGAIWIGTEVKSTIEQIKQRRTAKQAGPKPRVPAPGEGPSAETTSSGADTQD